MSFFLGVDLGTSSVRSLIFDTETKKEFVGQINYTFDIPFKHWAEQDPEEWWTSFAKSLEIVLEKAGISGKNIDAISFSGQMHGLVLLNKLLKPIRPAILWCDSRTSKIVNECNNNAEVIKLLKDQTLNKMHTGFALASLIWLQQNEPQNYSQIYKIISPKDYIRFKLCGSVGTEITDASANLMFNVKEKKWSTEIQKKFSLDSSIFPIVKNPIDFAGNIRKDVAFQLNLNPNCKVYFGGADQVMQAIGNGVVDSTVASLTIGTGGQVLSLLPDAVCHPSLNSHTFNYVFDDSYYFLGATLSAGLSLRWLKDNILKCNSYEEMDEEASLAPVGSDGLVFLPYLMGERTPYSDPYATGMFFGLNIKHSRREMIRSVLEGVIFALNDSFSLMLELRKKPQYIIATGGGAQSKIWLQIQADMLGYPIYTNSSSEQACIGAAICAAVGNGFYNNVKEACEDIVHKSNKPFMPIEKNMITYKNYYKLFQELYKSNKDLMHERNIYE